MDESQWDPAPRIKHAILWLKVLLAVDSNEIDEGQFALFLFLFLFPPFSRSLPGIQCAFRVGLVACPFGQASQYTLLPPTACMLTGGRWTR